MREYTSFRAGGKAALLLEPESREELAALLKELAAAGQSFLILGNGTDTLVLDEGIADPVIRIGQAFSGIEINGNEMVLGAGTLMSAAAKAAADAGLTGFEGMSGIPGSVGGGIFMNAGAYGDEMKDIAVSCEVMLRDGSGIRTIPKEDLDLSYRHSRFSESGEIVLSVRVRLQEGDREAILEKMRDLTAKRSSKQPLQYPSAGSFFKRPEGDFAGRLIEEAGLKGLAVGGAEVSRLHAGFIVNRGGATAQDIVDLMHLVQNTVYAQSGIWLKPEVRIVPDKPET